MPIKVSDNIRTLLHAIVCAELRCGTLNTEKYSGDDASEAVFYIRAHMSAIDQALAGGRIDRKLLRHAVIERRDFLDWCTRRTIPLPEFWFPPGWRIDYPWEEVNAERERFADAAHTLREKRKELEDRGDLTSDQFLGELGKINAVYEQATGQQPEESLAVLSTPQRIKIATQVVAQQVWRESPDTNITHMADDERVRKYGGSQGFTSEVVRLWLREVAPDAVKGKRGRPPATKK